MRKTTTGVQASPSAKEGRAISNWEGVEWEGGTWGSKTGGAAGEDGGNGGKRKKKGHCGGTLHTTGNASKIARRGPAGLGGGQLDEWAGWSGPSRQS